MAEEIKINNCTCGNENKFNSLYHLPTCTYRKTLFDSWFCTPDHGVVLRFIDNQIKCVGYYKNTLKPVPDNLVPYVLIWQSEHASHQNR